MRHIIIIVFSLVCLSVRGQYFPIYSQYMMNGLAINPAYAGSRDVLSASVMYRNQWVGFDGAPVTMTLGAHWPFRNKALAAGLLMTSEKIGVMNNISCFGNYAYRFRVQNGFFSLGLKAGFELWKENQSKILTQDENDGAFNRTSASNTLPNFGFGIYYYTDKYFFGTSVPLILSYREKSNNTGYEAYHNIKNYNYLISAGYLLDINEIFKIKPSTLLRYRSDSPFQYDLNCNFILLKDGNLWLGVSYRAGEAMVGLAEFQLNTQLRIGYSYDYSLGTLSKYNNGTHEVMLRYEFRYVLKAINPKYF